MAENDVTGKQKIIRCHRSSHSSIHEIDRETVIRMTTSEYLSYADGAPVPDYVKTAVATEWNDSGIFVYFRGAFREIRYATNLTDDVLQKKTHHLWEVSDVFEVFIGPNAVQRRMYKEFQAAPDGRWVDIDVWNALGTSNHYWYSGCAVKSFVDTPDNVWTSVLFFPRRCFDAERDSAGEWNVNFYRASGKFHGDELLSWSPVGTGPRCFHRPEHFGIMTFLSDKA